MELAPQLRRLHGRDPDGRVGDPPWLDLDNLAKALLDAIKGYLFHDDAQVARLLVERREGERERITIRVFPRQSPGADG